MKEIKYSEWNDLEKIKYFGDLVYGMEHCSECDSIDVDMNKIQDLYITFIREVDCHERDY